MVDSSIGLEENERQMYRSSNIKTVFTMSKSNSWYRKQETNINFTNLMKKLPDSSNLNLQCDKNTTLDAILLFRLTSQFVCHHS